MRIPSGVTDQYIYFVAVDATDLKTRETGLTSFTVYRSRNGGAAAAMTTPTVNETDATNMPGVYELLLDEDMTIDAGDDSQEMVFHITQAAMAPVTRTIELYRPKITAGNTLGVAADGDLLEVNTLTGHTAQTGDNFTRLGAPAGASVSADIADVPTVSEFNARTLASADYFDPAADTVANVTTVATTIANTDMRGTDNAALASVLGALADAAADGDPTSADTVMQYVKQLINILVGTAGIVTFPAEAAPANAVSLAEVIRAIHADVTGLNGDAMRGTDGANTTTPPTAAAVAGAVWDEAKVGHVAAGSFGEEVQAHALSSEISALNDLSAAQVNAEVDTALADYDAPTKAELDSGLAALNDLDAAGIRTAVGLATANLDTQLDALPTAAENADAVWDEARSGHITAGTFGESFNGVVNGQAVTGTLSTTQMTTNLTEATDDHYNGRIVVFITGVLAGQATDITDYTGSTKLITMTALTEAPSNGDRFVIV